MNDNEAEELTNTLSELIEKSPPPFDFQEISQFQQKLQSSLEDIEQRGNNVYRAPSVFHAILICINELAKASTGIPFDENVSHKEAMQITSPLHSLCFRGEECIKYRLSSSYHRIKPGTTYSDEVNKSYRTRAHSLANYFSPILQRATDQCTELAGGQIGWENTLFQAACQHHQIPTDLIDWTTDPFVAAMFASQGSCKCEDNLAQVYILPTHRAIENGGEVLLPPPFIERIYLQRGFFIRSKDFSNDARIESECMKIIFPQNKDFRIRRNRTEVELLIEDEWLKSLRAEAERWISENAGQVFNDVEDIAELDRRIAAVLQRHPIPDYLAASNAANLVQDWAINTIEMINRLASFNHFGNYKLNPYVLKSVTCNNKTIMRAIARSLLAGNNPPESNRTLAQLVNQQLQECEAN